MESYGNIFDEDQWHPLDRMFSLDEAGSEQFAKQGLMTSPCDLGLNFKIPNMVLNVSDNSSNVDSFVTDDEQLVNMYNDINPNFHHFFSQENSTSSTDINPNFYHFCPSNVVPQLSNDVCDHSIGFHMMNEINNSSHTTQLFSEENHYLTQDTALVPSRETTLKRKLEMHEFPDAACDEVINDKTDKNFKKRIRVSRDNKNNKNVEPKKNQKINATETRNKKNNIGEMNGQSSSSCSSIDDLNSSQDLNGASNEKSKTRASRGTATDPQSLYARKRRERINERLRILQNLVPNGTKVDISTMLEEAVEYVKFLKLQIQLLSSDDMWMYAPIAYNGMDMGLYQNISQNLRT